MREISGPPSLFLKRYQIETIESHKTKFIAWLFNMALIGILGTMN